MLISHPFLQSWFLQFYYHYLYCQLLHQLPISVHTHAIQLDASLHKFCRLSFSCKSWQYALLILEGSNHSIIFFFLASCFSHQLTCDCLQLSRSCFSSQTRHFISFMSSFSSWTLSVVFEAYGFIFFFK